MSKEQNTPQASRRKFLTGSAAAATGAATLGFPMISKGARTNVIKMQGSWGAGDIFNEQAIQYADMVNEMGGGELRVDYLNAGAVVKAFQVQDAVDKGILDAGHMVPAYWFGKNKAASLFGTGPVYGWDPHQLLSWFYFGGGDKLYQNLTQKVLGLNVVGFFLYPMPTQPLGWFKFRPKSPKDLKNLKYRTVGLATSVMQDMGMKVTQLPGGEIIPAMEKGVIEAFEYNNPYSDERFGAADVAKYYMLSSYHQPSEMLEIEFNKTKWDSLPKEHQAILRNAVYAASSTNLWLALPKFSSSLQDLKHNKGVHVYRTPESILKAQLGAWDKVVRKYGGEEEFGKISKAQKAWARDVAYYVLLNSHDTKLAYNHYYGKEQPLGF